MKYFAAVAATSALFTTTLAAPGACRNNYPPSSPPPNDTDGSVFQIKDFSVRKLNGKDISNVSFRILATNGGTLDFQCIPYNPATDAVTTNFVPGQVYFCGKDSSLSFSYTPKHDDQKQNELWLWQTITQEQVYAGHVDFDDPICRAGGAGQQDLICDVPQSVDLFVTVEKAS